LPLVSAKSRQNRCFFAGVTVSKPDFKPVEFDRFKMEKPRRALNEQKQISHDEYDL